jgi:hypothetical protein
MTAKTDALEPHPVTLDEQPRKPRRKTLRGESQKVSTAPAPHTGRPIRGCTCWSCEMHRLLDRQALRDLALAAMYEDAASGEATLGKTATEALRQALGTR